MQNKDTPLALNVIRLSKYNFNDYSLDEIVFFEYIIVKYKSFGYKPFYHSSETIFSETGLKRSRLDKCIARFQAEGVLSIEVMGFPKVKWFAINIDVLPDFVTKIYQFVENNKLNAENNKLIVDFYKLYVENSKQKEHIQVPSKRNKKETDEKNRHELAKNKFSHELVFSFLNSFEKTFNTRRGNTDKYPYFYLPYQKEVLNTAVEAFNHFGQKQIGDAWLVFCDKIISGDINAKKLLPYFFSKDEDGTFDTINTMMSESINYTYKK